MSLRPGASADFLATTPLAAAYDRSKLLISRANRLGTADALAFA
jgi:hypothetical protein